MELFIELKKNLAFLGIKPDGKMNFNLQNIAIMLLFTCFLVGMTAFIIFKLNSIIDFVHLFYNESTVALNICTFSSNVVKRNEIFELFNRFEDVIKNRKFDPNFILLDLLLVCFTGSSNRAKIYVKVNEKIEKSTKIVYLSFVKVTNKYY